MNFVEREPTFNQNIDEDYDILELGISRINFCNTYSDWIAFCAGRRNDVSSLQYVGVRMVELYDMKGGKVAGKLSMETNSPL